MQRWIWQQQWTELRDIQEQAIVPILSGQRDVILSAATASGKTEAAFLPIFSRLASERAPSTQPSGIQVLYISPLKALINDQHQRLSELAELLEIPIHSWHGDIGASQKQKVLSQPAGVVLITPESLEALLIRRGDELATLFQPLSYFVIDELHAFIGSERGKQLQSLLHRVEWLVKRPIPRIGLSATMGNPTLAAEFIRPGKGDAVLIIHSCRHDRPALKIQLRGYREAAFGLQAHQPEKTDSSSEVEIAAHLFRVLRGNHNLIFTNRRSTVEAYVARLRQLCEERRVPNEFLPHHGSLSKELRADAEQALRGERPTTVICTTTLEMGIDVGGMTSIAQIGAPFSVTSLRQRLGRSGRRSGDAILRCYISEPEVTPETSPQDSLHPELVQTIAMIHLLLQRWYESPTMTKLHLSTLIQQVLSLIAQLGGVSANQAWQILCETGAFSRVTKPLFAQVLRCLGTHDLIQQSQDGLLLLGEQGEQLVNHYSFYSAFHTPEEYRVVSICQTLGTLPVDYPLVEEQCLIFAGERWQILSVDRVRRVVEVAKTDTGRAPIFSGSRGWIHDRIRQEMYRIYCSEDVPIFLNATARDLLREARDSFTQHNLAQTSILANGWQTLVFCWMGDRVMNTLLVQLQAQGVSVSRDAIALIVNGLSPQEVRRQLYAIAVKPLANPDTLATRVKNLIVEKSDHFLSQELLCQNYASGFLDVQTAQDTARRMVSSGL